MSSNGVQAATVETLTAEVRVLMVGSRQITLSVARQLDWIPLEDLTVFGRVKLGGGGDISAIGRGPTGDLCLARVQQLWGVRRVFIDEEDLDGRKVRVCRSAVNHEGYANVRFGGTPIELQRGTYETCDVPKHRFYSSYTVTAAGAPSCGRWDSGDCREAIEAAIARDMEYVALHKAAAEAPLIVLAGLR